MLYLLTAFLFWLFCAPPVFWCALVIVGSFQAAWWIARQFGKSAGAAAEPKRCPSCEAEQRLTMPTLRRQA